jgi:putative peptidoglycan lipid II flippase
MRFQQRPSSAAATLAFFMVLAKILSFLQQSLLARVLGASPGTDAFFIAQVVPMLVGGVLASALTTSLARDLAADPDPEKPPPIIVVTAIFSLALGAVWFVLSGPAVSILAAGFDPETSALSKSLARLMAAMLVLYGVTGAAQGTYYARSQFLFPAVSSLLPYAGGVLALIVLVPSLGIVGLVLGILAGLAFQSILLLAPLLARRFALKRIGRRVLAYLASDFGAFGRRYILIAFSLLVSQLYFIANRSMASLYGPGWVAVFGFAATAFSLPLQLILMSLGGAFLPGLSVLATAGEKEKFANQSQTLLATLVFVFLPLALLLFFGSRLLVSILFQGNAFREGDTVLTAGIVAAYSFGLLGYAVKDMATFILIALRREHWPVVVGLAGLILNLGASLVLGRLWGPQAIAYVTSACFLVNAAALVIVLHRSVRLSWGSFLRRSGWRIGFSGAAMAGAYLVLGPVFRVVFRAGSSGTIAGLFRLGFSLAVYLLVSKWTKIPEWGMLWTRYSPLPISIWKRAVSILSPR